MRIQYFGDGTSIHVRRWVSWFAVRGHDVALISKECDPIPGIHILTIPLHHGAYRPRGEYRAAVAKAVEAFGPDILHAHYLQGWGRYAALQGAHPLVVSAWGSDIAKDPDTGGTFKRWYVRRATRKILRRADMIHVGDAASRDRVAQLGGDPGRCFVQPWAVDTAMFSPGRRSGEWRRSICPTDRVLFLANRHMHAIFRHDVLLRAAGELRKETDRFSVVLVGGGPELEGLRKIARDAGLEGVATFTGRVPPDDMPMHYASADVYVDCFDSQVGGHGASLSLAEAMASGLAVVAASRPGLAEFVGEAGFCVPPDDPKALADHLMRFVADPGLAPRMGRLALERVRSVADREKNLRVFEGRMEALIASRGITRRPSP